MKEYWKHTIIMIIAVCLAGEIKIFPFHDSFRVSFAPSTFLFILLFMPNIPSVFKGIIIGFSIIIFRIGLDWVSSANFYLTSDFKLHFSAFFYYIVYSLLFSLLKVNSLHNRPFLIGVTATLIDILSSIIELIFRYFILKNSFSIIAIMQISIVAIIRSFFVLGFFNIIKLQEVKIISEQQQEQNKHMLLLISDLYEESIQLKKTLQDAENITKECYELYEQIQNHSPNLSNDELARKLLGLAGQVHEIKKDNQRIYAGLTKMIKEENSTDFMYAKDIGTIVVETNQTYAQSLGKNVSFSLTTDELLPLLHVYTVLSLANNLVSNSVESIDGVGAIYINILKKEESALVVVSDTGPGIPEKRKDLVFKPGYTTKYDITGKPSTGMGLAYIKEVVSNLKGNITLELKPRKTTFIISIPINSLAKKG